MVVYIVAWNVVHHTHNYPTTAGELQLAVPKVPTIYPFYFPRVWHAAVLANLARQTPPSNATKRGWQWPWKR
ncbi:hypothetical protein MKEN_00769000 [Mycena kentingensis (nom. inval.)]|nr:hypothetical protein MKEN_00769000 [Mycena kentingensis (nom. inval.)]